MRLKTLMLLSVFAILLLAGCTAPNISGPTQPAAQNCSKVTEVKPVTTQQCSNISTTEQVCGVRKLPYGVVHLPKIDLCVVDDACIGKPLSQCNICTTAMTRCTLAIQNLDSQESGTWTVGASYKIGNAGFNKDPITQTIKPNETFAFDFQQMYAPGYPTNSASCNVTITAEATVNDCHGETRNTVECKNVTTNASVETIVCK
jgi:hypothetical protein